MQKPRKLDGTIKNDQSSSYLPRIGKIRLGIKEGVGDREHPKETEYFVVPDAVKKVYGERPTEIRIFFPLNDERIIFPKAYKWYGAGSLKCIGDGAIAYKKKKFLTPEQIDEAKRLDGLPDQDFEQVEVQCPCPMLDAKNGCRKIGTLNFMIPDVSMAGVFQLDLKGGYSYGNVSSGLLMAKMATMSPARPEGNIAMIPFKLIRKPQKIEWQGQMRTHYIVSLEHQLTMEQISKIRSGGVPALPAPDVRSIAVRENPGPVDPGFQEEPGSRGVIEDVPPEDRLVPHNVEILRVAEVRVSDGRPRLFSLTADRDGSPISFKTEDLNVATLSKSLCLRKLRATIWTRPDDLGVAVKVEEAEF